MSYGIVRVQKMGAGSVKGIEIHDKQQKESRTNPDIDVTKKCLNYNLAESDDLTESYQKIIKKLREE